MLLLSFFICLSRQECSESASISRAYDRAAIKFRGVDADINFNLSDYEEDLNQVPIVQKKPNIFFIIFVNRLLLPLFVVLF